MCIYCHVILCTTALFILQIVRDYVFDHRHQDLLETDMEHTANRRLTFALICLAMLLKYQAEKVFSEDWRRQWMFRALSVRIGTTDQFIKVDEVMTGQFNKSDR